MNGILWVVLGGLILYNGYMLFARYALKQGMPQIMGFSFAVVVTGSMEPEISAGDFIVNQSADRYVVGDVITFYDAQMGEYVTHRVILAEDGRYLTKGDANNGADRFSVPSDAVVGKVVAVFRGVGGVVSFFQSPLGLFALIGGGILIWTAMRFVADRAERKVDSTEDPEGLATEQGEKTAGKEKQSS